MTALPYSDRLAAARVLLSQLRSYRGRSDVIVLALPRGGVPVGCEIARGLGVDFDILVVRKLGLPGHSELAMGAVAGTDIVLRNRQVIRASGVSEDAFEAVERREREEVRRREKAYRGNRPTPSLSRRCVILVDDGLATGSTIIAAIEAVRRRHPSRVVVAVPVAPPDTIERLQREADEVVCPATPPNFRAIGQFYEDFSQLDDREVRAWLREAWQDSPAHQPD